MPQGAAGSPAWFVSVMRLVTDGLDNIRMYLDDGIGSDDSPMSHVVTLATFFARLRLHNLKLSPNKSRIGAARVDFLGHVISQDGVCSNDDQTAALAQMPMPQTSTTSHLNRRSQLLPEVFTQHGQTRAFNHVPTRKRSYVQLHFPYGGGRSRPTRRTHSPTNTRLSRLGRCYRQVSTIPLTL